MDRLRALGNAAVSKIVETVGTAILAASVLGIATTVHSAPSYLGLQAGAQVPLNNRNSNRYEARGSMEPFIAGLVGWQVHENVKLEAMPFWSSQDLHNWNNGGVQQSTDGSLWSAGAMGCAVPTWRFLYGKGCLGVAYMEVDGSNTQSNEKPRDSGVEPVGRVEVGAEVPFGDASIRLGIGYQRTGFSSNLTMSQVDGTVSLIIVLGGRR